MALEINGPIGPPPESIKRIRKQEVSSPTNANLAFVSLRRGWGQYPPAFAQPGKALEALGLERYQEAVKTYWEAIRDERQQRFERAHRHWVVRQVLRTFETHVRGFRRQEVGRRGGLFITSSDVLVQPQLLMDEGRLIADLDGILDAYQVSRDGTKALVLRKLRALWGVR